MTHNQGGPWIMPRWAHFFIAKAFIQLEAFVVFGVALKLAIRLFLDSLAWCSNPLSYRRRIRFKLKKSNSMEWKISLAILLNYF
jgi:hypothetical protein